EPAQQVGDEAVVPVGDLCRDVARRGTRRGADREVLRNEQIDSVRSRIDVRVDPVQLGLELRGRQAGGAEHAEATRLADGDDHVAAMAEGEQRKVDAEHRCKPVVHPAALLCVQRPRVSCRNSVTAWAEAPSAAGANSMWCRNASTGWPANPAR